MCAAKFVTTPNLSRMFVLGDVSILKLQLSNKLTSRIFQLYHLSMCITYTFPLSDFPPSTDFLQSEVTFGFSMSFLPTKQGNPSTNKEPTKQPTRNAPSKLSEFVRHLPSFWQWLWIQFHRGQARQFISWLAQ